MPACRETWSRLQQAGSARDLGHGSTVYRHARAGADGRPASSAASASIQRDKELSSRSGFPEIVTAIFRDGSKADIPLMVVSVLNRAVDCWLETAAQDDNARM